MLDWIIISFNLLGAAVINSVRPHPDSALDTTFEILAGAMLGIGLVGIFLKLF
jgi:hypothetical protein